MSQGPGQPGTAPAYPAPTAPMAYTHGQSTSPVYPYPHSPPSHSPSRQPNLSQTYTAGPQMPAAGPYSTSSTAPVRSTNYPPYPGYAAAPGAHQEQARYPGYAEAQHPVLPSRDHTTVDLADGQKYGQGYGDEGGMVYQQEAGGLKPGPRPLPVEGHVVQTAAHELPHDGAAAHNEEVQQVVQVWTQDVRRGFTRKVLAIVCLQLLVTVGVAAAFLAIDPVKVYVTTNSWVVWGSLIVAFAVLITMACSGRARRRFPVNYVFLIVFTLAFSVVVGSITARYDVEAIAIAFAVTCACVAGAFFVAMFTKLDLTKAGGFLTAVLFGVIAMSIIAIFWRNKWFYFAIALVAAILFTAFLIYDLQMVMGGKTYSISPDEYIFASINIYLDIIQIFLNILQLVGIARS